MDGILGTHKHETHLAVRNLEVGARIAYLEQIEDVVTREASGRADGRVDYQRLT
jgi:ribulose 1,5-bisphosphate synthetase/thiazole synthase